MFPFRSWACDFAGASYDPRPGIWFQDFMSEFATPSYFLGCFCIYKQILIKTEYILLEILIASLIKLCIRLFSDCYVLIGLCLFIYVFTLQVVIWGKLGSRKNYIGGKKIPMLGSLFLRFIYIRILIINTYLVV